jgi:hypothetical protein
MPNHLGLDSPFPPCQTSWRKIYFWSMIITTFFSFLQLMLIFQVCPHCPLTFLSSLSHSFSLPFLSVSLSLDLSLSLSRPQINTKYLHISNYFFSLGDDVISAYISGIQFLPVIFTPSFPCLSLFMDHSLPSDVYHVYEIMPRWRRGIKLLHAHHLQ